MKHVKAKKYLGQHFLNNDTISESIVSLINSNTEFVMEVGPGMGALTKHLIKKNWNFEIIEIDKESISYLETKYPEIKRNIVKGDFLKLDLKDYSKKISIVGNFPYNISNQILYKIYENNNQVKEVIGMFQKEVAERITAKSGRKKGILSILIQTFYDTKYCFTVKNDSFSPKPKVESAVIKLNRNNRNMLICDNNLFVKIIKASFNQRRKTLRNALKSFSLENELKELNFSRKRAEELSVEDFINLTNLCQKRIK